MYHPGVNPSCFTTPFSPPVIAAIAPLLPDTGTQALLHPDLILSIPWVSAVTATRLTIEPTAKLRACYERHLSIFTIVPVRHTSGHNRWPLGRLIVCISTGSPLLRGTEAMRSVAVAER
ncbi:hypothetical protein BaRGS_00021277 [Batillaria attramentaria]|uniref:Uncharacterized protein n=1 Tax=Batillaria attramentaria TaxID=370345 RepID=A0ABD0KJN0_9CAEN